MGLIRFDVSGWRARVGSGFDADHVSRLARALGEVWAWRHPGATVLVGYDTRRDSQRMAQVAGRALASCGLAAVVSAGPCPLPALAWSCAQDGACVGAVMITAAGASHEHGGIVARGADGGPISAAFAGEVEQRIAGNQPVGDAKLPRRDVTTPYLDALVARMGGRLVAGAAPRVVVDALYGATAGWATQLFSRLGCEVIGIHDEAICDFRGLHPKAQEPWVDECERTVREHHASLGIAFDGDGDRMGVVDETGRLISVHDLAPLALAGLTDEASASGVVAAGYTTSARLERQAELLGYDFVRAAGGFDAVYREFVDQSVVLGADERGSLAAPAHLKARDGLLGACLVSRALLQADGCASCAVERLSDAVGRTIWGKRSVPLDPASVQRLRNILPGVNPQEFAGKEPMAVSHALGLRLSFDDGSWVAVSVSDARPALVVCAETLQVDELPELLTAAVALADI